LAQFSTTMSSFTGIKDVRKTKPECLVHY